MKNKIKNFFKKNGNFICFIFFTLTLLLSLNLMLYSIALLINIIESEYTKEEIFIQLMYHSDIFLLSLIGTIGTIKSLNNSDLIKGLKQNENQKSNT